MMAMEGYVNAEPKEPRLAVLILNASGIAVPLEMTIDTGFTGFMTLRPWATRALGLESGKERRMMLADGQIVTTPTYRATAIWHGNPLQIDVLELDARPVIGMSLLWNSDVAIAARENGRVTITEATESLD